MRLRARKYAAVLAAGALCLAAAAAITAPSPAAAAPLPPNTAAIRTTAKAPISDVYYRGRCYYRRYCARGYYRRGYYYGRPFYRRRYAYPYWRYGYPPSGCENTFPASCSYPYPYFGFVYGWHGIW
jgi:hypothetical protein